MPVRNWALKRADLPAIDEFIAEMRRGVFETESMRRRTVQEQNTERRRRWTTAGACFFPSCDSSAIVASHSLSRMMMLGPISDGHHVYGPEVNTFDGQYAVKRVPVSKASVFPGFCTRHEGAFAFESSGQISDPSEYQMQLFRSICRHRFFVEHERQSLEVYLETMNREFGRRFAEFLGAIRLSTAEDVVRGYCHEVLLGDLEFRKHQRTLDSEYTEHAWYDPLGRVFGKPIPPVFAEITVHSGDLLPMVISGPVLPEDCPRDESGTPDFSHTMYVNVFPNGGETVLHCVTSGTEKEKLAELEKLLVEPKHRNDQLAKWITASCDHWYMSPGHWHELPGEEQERLRSQL